MLKENCAGSATYSGLLARTSIYTTPALLFSRQKTPSSNPPLLNLGILSQSRQVISLSRRHDNQGENATNKEKEANEATPLTLALPNTMPSPSVDVRPFLAPWSASEGLVGGLTGWKATRGRKKS